MLTLDRCTPEETPVEYFKTIDTTIIGFKNLEIVASKDNKESIYHPYRDRTNYCCTKAKQNGTQSPKTYKLENIHKQLCPQLDPGERTIIFGNLRRSPQAVVDKHHQLNLATKLSSNYHPSQFETLAMVYGSLIKHHEKTNGWKSTLLVWGEDAETIIRTTQKTLLENRDEERLQKMFLQEALNVQETLHVLNTHKQSTKEKLQNLIQESIKEIINDPRMWLTPTPRPLAGASWQVMKLFYQIENHSFMHIPQGIKTYLEYKQLQLTIEFDKDTQKGQTTGTFEKNTWVETPTVNPAVVEILESLYEPRTQETTKPYAGEFIKAHQVALTLI